MVTALSRCPGGRQHIITVDIQHPTTPNNGHKQPSMQHPTTPPHTTTMTIRTPTAHHMVWCANMHGHAQRPYPNLMALHLLAILPIHVRLHVSMGHPNACCRMRYMSEPLRPEQHPHATTDLSSGHCPCHELFPLWHAVPLNALAYSIYPKYHLLSTRHHPSRGKTSCQGHSSRGVSCTHS